MSSIGNIQFGPSLTYLGGTIFGAVSSINDLDNDGKSELIIVNGTNLTVVKNTSTPGTISFIDFDLRRKPPSDKNNR